MRSLLLLFAICTAAAQDVQIPPDLFALTLTVTDESSQPVPDAEVSLDTKIVGYTDRDGKYYLPRSDVVRGYGLHVLDLHVLGIRVSAAGFQDGTANLEIKGSGEAVTKALSIQLHHPPSGEPAPVHNSFGRFGGFSERTPRPRQTAIPGTSSAFITRPTAPTQGRLQPPSAFQASAAAPPLCRAAIATYRSPSTTA